MALSSSSGDGGPVAEINVTPLVDVMLVLLIIFMVTAPMMQQGVDVDLPKATNRPLKSSEDPLILSVNREGTIFLGQGNVVRLDEVGAKVSAIMEARKEVDRKVYIKGDTGISYGRIMEVMGRLHENGIEQIGLISAAPESSPTESTRPSKGNEKR
jgi:biopolymer transport protein TolR